VKIQHLVLFAFIACVSLFAQNQPAPIIVIHAGTLIDGHSDQPLKNRTIVIRGNRIESVGDASTAIPAGAKVIDLGNATVLPGLIDTHTHLFLQGEDPALGGYDIQLLKFSQAYRAARATVSARRALEQGFTTIRDMETEGAGYGDVGIKQAVNEGWIPGPRIFTTTRAISTTGGYPLEGYAPEIQRDLPKGVEIVDGPVEARKAAREQMSNGADWIKVYMTHRSWIDKQGHLVSQPTLTLEEIKAITDEAHGWKKKVACHAYGGEGLQRAIDGGCDSIEHGLDMTDAQIAQMKRQGTWYVPTLAIYYQGNADPNTEEGKRDRARWSAHEVSFKKAMAAGVKIAFGTDVGGFDWKQSIAQEFPVMVKLGMTPMQAIKCATQNAADLLDAEGQVGAIAPGASADVIAVDGDPLAQIDLLQKVQFVMKDGTVYKSAGQWLAQ
jgi:imidazolonepropionase-like amidohydrolase